MTFPDSQRVIYSENPLESVVCQLRFPPILRIDAEVPANFQDRIRHEYPLFADNQPMNQGLDIPPEITKLMGLDLQLQTARRGYDFSTSDGLWKISLTREFLALTTNKYETWGNFKDHLKGPLEVLLTEYKPDFYSRVGLRYRDVIKRSLLNLKDVPWAELLKPHITGELSSEVAPFIRKAGREILVELESSLGHVRIKHGIIQPKDSAEELYLFDADFYTDQKMEIGHAIERLDRFNREAGHFFRWCITERLHDAMGPRSL